MERSGVERNRKRGMKMRVGETQGLVRERVRKEEGRKKWGEREGRGGSGGWNGTLIASFFIH